MSANPKRFPVRLNTRDGTVDMTHGSGGRSMAQLIEEMFVKHFDNDLLRQANDQAAFDVTAGRMVISTDGHVISPLFFPGGDIGSLSVHGTVNDVAMSGAQPLYLSAGFILEEGFPLADLEQIVASMGRAASSAGVPVVTGDTKVVERGKGDGVFITTTGVGVIGWGLWSLIATVGTFFYEETGLPVEEILINNGLNEGLLLSAVVIALGVIVLELKRIQAQIERATNARASDGG